MRLAKLSITLFVVGIVACATTPIGAADDSAPPANTWTLIHEEGPDGGKTFSQAIFAADAGCLYLWGAGGKLRNRSTYDRYELESFSIGDAKPNWIEALPASKREAWANQKWPPFRLYGQEGIDGPRMTLVGSGQPNVVQFFETDGLSRPSPMHTFNQACYDSKRKRILYFGGGKTLALDPATNTFTDLNPTATPIACNSLSWGSLSYDAANDEAVLFGGGLAFNREGGARTWIYDCAKNTWFRPEIKGDEPTPRCTTGMVYDATTQSMLLFGGYDQTSARNDTWVYRSGERKWERRKPKFAPPPMFAVAAAPVGGGKVLVVGSNALTDKETHSASRDPKETWIYDIAKNSWQPLSIQKIPSRWLTAAADDKGTVWLVAFEEARRKTFAFRFDEQAHSKVNVPPEMKGAPSGTLRIKYPEQAESLAAAPPADEKAHAKFLAELPVNQFVDAKPPGKLLGKTWSGATIDTDRSEVIYTGGGHSGYSGNDVAVFSIRANRWSLDAPPRFPPYLEGTNGSVYGWSLGARPWSQHTYLWYAYDPISKKVIYCVRPEIRDGESVQLTDDPKKAFVYDRKTHGQWTWLFDPATRKLSLPSFGRPFSNPWELCCVETPRGVYACTREGVWVATVRGDSVEWKALGGPLPVSKSKDYNYEWLPMVYDSKRERLIHLMGGPDLLAARVRSLDDTTWTELPTTGTSVAGRELAYLPKHDLLLLLARDRLFALDLAKNLWRELDISMPAGMYGTEAAMLYDRKHDVSVLLLPNRETRAIQTFYLRVDPGSAKWKE